MEAEAVMEAVFWLVNISGSKILQTILPKDSMNLLNSVNPKWTVWTDMEQLAAFACFVTNHPYPAND